MRKAVEVILGMMFTSLELGADDIPHPHFPEKSWHAISRAVPVSGARAHPQNIWHHRTPFLRTPGALTTGPFFFSLTWIVPESVSR